MAEEVLKPSYVINQQDRAGGNDLTATFTMRYRKDSDPDEDAYYTNVATSQTALGITYPWLDLSTLDPDTYVIHTYQTSSGSTSGTKTTVVLNSNDTYNPSPAIAYFDATTFVSGDTLNESEIANIKGGNGVTVTITLDTLTNPNGGQLKVNGVEAFEGNTWDVLLDADGKGSLNVSIEGVDNPGTAILGHFTITAVSEGTIGSPDSYQISKTFS